LGGELEKYMIEIAGGDKSMGLDLYFQSRCSGLFRTSKGRHLLMEERDEGGGAGVCGGGGECAVWGGGAKNGAKIDELGREGRRRLAQGG